MPLTPEQTRELIRMVRATRDREMTCDECLAEIAEFVQVRLLAKPLSRVLETIRDHLEACPDCHEEYTLLRQAVEALDSEA